MRAMPASPWTSLARNAARGDLFHIIDTETTGTSPPGSRVIEVACLTLRQGEVVGRFETLIDPGRPIPPFITRLTGITTAMVRGQARPAEAMAAFAAYLAERPGHFVAHNAGFDYRFLEFEFAQAGLEWPFKGRYCTVRLSRHCNPQLRRHNLDTLIQHYGVVMADRHRAMADVEATATAFWRMVEGLPEGPGMRDGEPFTLPGVAMRGSSVEAAEGPPAPPRHPAEALLELPPIPPAPDPVAEKNPLWASMDSLRAPQAAPAPRRPRGRAPKAGEDAPPASADEPGEPADAFGDSAATLTARVPVVISSLPPRAWQAVLRAVEAEKRPLAALLEQHGRLGEPGADGAIPVALPAKLYALVDASRLAVLEAAVRQVLGPDACVRLVALEPEGVVR